MRVAVYISIAIGLALGLLWACGSTDPTPPPPPPPTTSVATTTVAATTSVAQRPDSNPGGPYEGMVERAVQFDGSGSTGATQLNYFWDFGDDSGEEGRGPRPTHTYASFCPTPTSPTEMTFTIRLQVRDDFGQEDTDTTTALILCTY